MVLTDDASRLRRRRSARAAMAGAALLILCWLGVDRGGLRRRTGPVRHVVPGSVVVRPSSLALERHQDGEYHYGLRFRAPWQGDRSRMAWYSVLDTRLGSRGSVAHWQCNSRGYDGTSVEVVVYLPRSWLILHGFLPVSAAFTPRTPQRLRDQPVLLKSFWLEVYEPSRRGAGTMGRFRLALRVPR